MLELYNDKLCELILQSQWMLTKPYTAAYFNWTHLETEIKTGIAEIDYPSSPDPSISWYAPSPMASDLVIRCTAFMNLTLNILIAKQYQDNSIFSQRIKAGFIIFDKI
jgi:hypothetical protein